MCTSVCKYMYVCLYFVFYASELLCKILKFENHQHSTMVKKKFSIFLSMPISFLKMPIIELYIDIDRIINK